ncbi:hypothetical protein LXL04_029008 [Taraxacum kok-saghyz]
MMMIDRILSGQKTPIFSRIRRDLMQCKLNLLSLESSRELLARRIEDQVWSRSKNFDPVHYRQQKAVSWRLKELIVFSGFQGSDGFVPPCDDFTFEER